MTTDRLRRYIFNTKSSKNGNRESTDYQEFDVLMVKDSVEKGDFVIMFEKGHILLGEVVNFQFLNESTQKLKRFSRKSCFVNCKDDVGITANWHLISESGSLMKISITHYNILQYVNQCCESVSERKHKKRRRKLCSFMLFGRIFCFLLEQ